MEDNITRIKKAVELYQPQLVNYVASHMKEEYGSGWWNEVLCELTDTKGLPYGGSDEELLASLKFMDALRLLDRKWESIFKYCLKDGHSWVTELLTDVKAVYDGNAQPDDTQTWRTLDTMARLAEPMDADTAEKICAIRDQETKTENVAVQEGDGLLLIKDKSLIEDTGRTHKLNIGGQTKLYPLYRVRLDQLFYNDRNDRIASWLSQVNGEGESTLDKNNREEYNNTIEKFIIESNPEAIETTKNNIALVSQLQPGVIMSDGRIIDGNRRFTCLRLLNKEDPSNTDFQYFETVILSATDAANTEKQIKLLELAIQHGTDEKVGYDQIDLLVGAYHDITETGLITPEEYAESVNMTAGEVKRRLATAQLLIDFLKFMNVPKQYHIARDMKVYSVLFEGTMLINKCKTEEEKNLLSRSIFANTMLTAIDDQRKYIRGLKTIEGVSSVFVDYLIEQDDLIDVLQDKMKASTITNKAELEAFVKANEELRNQMTYSFENALSRTKKSLTRGKPAQIVAKSTAQLMDIDTKILDTLSDEDVKNFADNLQQLKDMVASLEESFKNSKKYQG